MSQQFFLILFLSLFALSKADIQLTGQPMTCNGTGPARPQLLNFTNLLIARGGREFSGSITILKNITSLRVSYDYSIEANGAQTGSFSDDIGNVCNPVNDLFDDSPASNVIDRIFMLNLPFVGCLPRLQAKQYNMNGVEVNQATLKGLTVGNIYVIQIRFNSTDAYSCIKLRGRAVADTN